MRTRFIFLAPAVALAAAAAWLAAFDQRADAQDKDLVGVASVIDGDTIEIHGARIRLQGYDTPEAGKRCGDVNVYQRAALALSDFIGSRTVTCADTGERNNQRVVGVCSVGNVDLGDHMVSQGWGRDWPRYSKKKYADEEARARAAKRGIWGMTCPADLWSGRNYQ